ncbi:MAG: aldehyde dehydrogenase, partial [Acidobacteriota bacterium]
MTTATLSAPTVAGIPQHTEIPSELADSSRPDMDAALRDLRAKKEEWVQLGLADRRAILAELIRDTTGIAGRWAEACREAEGIPAETSTAAEEWLAGPYMVLRNLQLLERALMEIEREGQPRIPGPVKTRPNGQVTARVFPQSLTDRLFYTGFSAEVWMQPGVTADRLAETQAVAYKTSEPTSGVCLVLGAGNVSSIGAMDLLYKLFVENRVVILKMHPLNAYLGPILAEGFQALLDWGVLRIVYGGADVGAYL